jgi:large subunit ribosomal protein L25
MEIRELTIEKREATGKGPARRLRRAGRVPAILYGGPTPVKVSVNPHDIYRLIHGHEGGTQLLQVVFNTGDDKTATDKRMAIIRDLQYDPVSEDVIHVDLQEVAMDKPLQVAVPLRHVGEARGVKDVGGILEMILREVQVSCLPSAIPEVITADVSDLGIHDVLTVRDLVVPEGVRILTDPGQAVATVAPPAAEEVTAAAAAPTAVAATPAEPEVLTERKPKEEAEEKKK